MDAIAYQLMERLGTHHWWFVSRRRILSRLIGRFLKPGSTILDFGAGTGEMSLFLKKGGYLVTAADIAPQALEGCRKRGLDTLDVSTHPLPHGTMDGVLAGDILEHLEEESTTLHRLRASLRPEGLLVVTVPAFTFLWSGNDNVSHHRRRYTRPQLVTLLTDAGFQVNYSSYFNFFLFLPILTVIVLQRLFAPESATQSNVRPTHPLLNKLLQGIFSAEGLLLPHITFPFGVSIIAIAKRKD